MPDDKSQLLSRFKDNSANLLEAVTAQRLVKGDVDLAKKLIGGMDLIAVDPQTPIITQGGADDDLYFILAGRFDIIVNGRIVAQRVAGDHVGEMSATVSSLRRSATVQAKELAVVGKIPSALLDQVAKKNSGIRTALRINGAVWNIIKPALKNQYPNNTYTLKHVVGVDTSKLLVARIGVRNDNDLVWVGRAANYAAKLSSLPDSFSTYITHTVHDNMNDAVIYGGVNKQNMWEERSWTNMNNMKIYASTWWFGV